MTIAERHQVPDEAVQNVLSPELEKALLEHQGQWVAMTTSELLAVGDSPDEVLGQAATLGHESPIVYRVPSDGDSLFIL